MSGCDRKERDGVVREYDRMGREGCVGVAGERKGRIKCECARRRCCYGRWWQKMRLERRILRSMGMW